MTEDLDLACNELVELVTAYVEGALPSRERARFDAHLAECPDCVEYVAQMHRTIAAVGLAAPELAPTPAVTALLGVFRDWKRGQELLERGRHPVRAATIERGRVRRR